ncbi:MAG: adenosylcobinamide-GDP ribazoletransferase [Butyricimonas faecihominis]
MKDSHIGCYGTIGLVLYFILYYSLLSSFDPAMIFPIVIAADCFSKLCAAVMVNTLPYVRKEEESKIKLVYSKVRTFIFVIVGVITLIPFFFLKDASFCFAMIPAILTAIGLRFFLKIKIGGYTGDCCGASVLIIEQVFYLERVSYLVSPSIFVLDRENVAE